MVKFVTFGRYSVNPERITYLFGFDDDKTTVHLSNGESFMVSKRAEEVINILTLNQELR